MSYRAHLEQVAKAKGSLPDELILPEINPMGEYLWELFNDMHRGRTYGMGANPLSWTDIRNWCILFGIDLSSWQIDTIKMIDTLWVKIVNEGGNG